MSQFDLMKRSRERSTDATPIKRDVTRDLDNNSTHLNKITELSVLGGGKSSMDAVSKYQDINSEKSQRGNQ